MYVSEPEVHSAFRPDVWLIASRPCGDLVRYVDCGRASSRWAQTDGRGQMGPKWHILMTMVINKMTGPLSYRSQPRGSP
jgi:hypothetical protein